jgi:hypothetical protein
MTMETDRIIQRLAAATTPVRVLPRPAHRTAMWCAVSVPAIAIALVAMLPAFDPASTPQLSDSRFVVEQMAALATGLTAAFAAFVTIVPGTDRRVVLLPLLPLAVWLGSVGHGCLQDWLRLGARGVSLGTDWRCVLALVVSGAAPAVVMATMLRRGAPLTPRATMALAGLAAAGLANVGLRLVHAQDASILVLVWHLGASAVLSTLAGWAGPSLLTWPSPASGETP